MPFVVRHFHLAIFILTCHVFILTCIHQYMSRIASYFPCTCIHTCHAFILSMHSFLHAYMHAMHWYMSCIQYSYMSWVHKLTCHVLTARVERIPCWCCVARSPQQDLSTGTCISWNRWCSSTSLQVCYSPQAICGRAWLPLKYSCRRSQTQVDSYVFAFADGLHQNII